MAFRCANDVGARSNGILIATREKRELVVHKVYANTIEIYIYSIIHRAYISEMCERACIEHVSNANRMESHPLTSLSLPLSSHMENGAILYPSYTERRVKSSIFFLRKAKFLGLVSSTASHGNSIPAL